MCRHGNRNAVERIFRELKRRTSSFSNCFSHVEPETAEKWLQSFARWHNAPNETLPETQGLETVSGSTNALQNVAPLNEPLNAAAADTGGYNILT